MKPRGMSMIGALVRDCSKMMKIVTGYRCSNRGEYIQFSGDPATAWYPLDSFEILSTED